MPISHQSVTNQSPISYLIGARLNTLCTFKHNSLASNLINITDDDNNNTHDDDDDSLSDQTSEDSTQDTQISQMLLQHQQRIMMRNNLTNVLDQLVSESDDKFELEHNTIDNSFFDIVNHDVQQKKGVNRMFIMQKMEETHVIFDEYTQKEHQKSNNKAANNLKNFQLL
ncbi:hypothetical protein RhiirB3_459169 [Rhizophagus irregularis]|nr:hypothetical protein RhiirB3_459169 [Rhizophagus irregularis]